MATESQIKVHVLYAPVARICKQCELRLPANSTAAQAVAVSGWLQALSPQDIDALGLAVWGKRITARHTLQEGDRLEILRPLTVDPKVARRERFVRQGAKSAGLFSKQRPGSKAGY